MRAVKHESRREKKARNRAGAKAAEKRAVKAARKAHTRDSLQALSKLAEMVDGRYRIVEPAADGGAPSGHRHDAIDLSIEEVEHALHDEFRAYRATLQDDRRRLLERFEIVDMARKVVGVGSVGTRAFIVLLQGRDQQDPLFLQVKEATASVLEAHLPKSLYQQPGERVVQGQRMMQAASDIFLGWTKGYQANRHLYWRQLRDMKGSADVEMMGPSELSFYRARLRSDLGAGTARSGDPIALAAYVGKKDRFDRSITDFAERYADQNEQDYQAFCDRDPDRSARGSRGCLIRSVSDEGWNWVVQLGRAQREARGHDRKRAGARAAFHVVDASRSWSSTAPSGPVRGRQGRATPLVRVDVPPSIAAIRFVSKRSAEIIFFGTRAPTGLPRSVLCSAHRDTAGEGKARR